jgi:ATP-dependent Lhr-like helicase
MTELVREHRTTLVFVNTRKMAERVAARLAIRLGADDVACHHGSLSTARRHDAEQRLKAGALKVLVATASLELGIDIGDVDLVIQVGASRSIATLLQRVGRAGHGVQRTPKGRVFPLTLDELVEAAALLRSIRDGILDRTPQPGRPLDILAQQIVAACVSETWDEDALYRLFCRAWPYRELRRQEFDEVVGVHTNGRWSLLHRDGVGRRIRATRTLRSNRTAGTSSSSERRHGGS